MESHWFELLSALCGLLILLIAAIYADYRKRDDRSVEALESSVKAQNQMVTAIALLTEKLDGFKREWNIELTGVHRSLSDTNTRLTQQEGRMEEFREHMHTLRNEVNQIVGLVQISGVDLKNATKLKR